MRVRSFEAPPGSGQHGWLEIDLEARAGGHNEHLRIEAGNPGVIRCAVGGVARLWARPARYLQGIWTLRSGHEESPGVMPPWRFEEARAAAKGDARVEWSKRVAERLLESEEPRVAPGTYRLASSKSSMWSGPGTRAPSRFGAGYESAQPEWTQWEGGFGITHPLRARPDDDDARVKAWRKAAREGYLPPLLLFWVSGMNAYVMLDGHARLRAAQLEHMQPEALVLWRVVNEPRDSPAWRATATTRYEAASRKHDAWRAGTAASMNDHLVSAFAPNFLLARTAATARADLRDAFANEVVARLRELGLPPGHEMLEGV